jgi:hypothetical protein
VKIRKILVLYFDQVKVLDNFIHSDFLACTLLLVHSSANEAAIRVKNYWELLKLLIEDYWISAAFGTNIVAW